MVEYKQDDPCPECGAIFGHWAHYDDGVWIHRCFYCEHQWEEGDETCG